MNFFRTSFITGFVALILALQWGCKEPMTDYKREKVFLDSLNNQLIATELALNIDENELQTRISMVNTWYVKLSDTTYDVAKKMQTDFNGFKVVYGRYIESFFVYETALKLNKTRYNALKERVEKQSITRTEFKEQYAQLKTEIDNNYAKAAEIAKPVYELELSWNRNSKTMDKWRR